MRTRLSRAVHHNGGVARVVIEHLSKVFTGPRGESIHAVVDASLSVEDKQFVVLVGPSGCGKTTTLRLIAGLEEASSGAISIDGQVVNDLAPRDRDIAMVFQNYALYPHMSVYENMAFGLKVRNHPKAEIEKRVKEAAEILDLLPCLNRKPAALSGGQRQRVAVGRAIVRQPKVFLFDEPLSNLDATLRAQMRVEISRLHIRLAATMIYVTHDQAEAMTLGQRIVVMKQGVIQQIDTPLKLYNEPDNLFVAGFLGSPPMNFINGELKQERDAIVFKETKGGTIEVRFADRPRAREFFGKAMLLGIRPEDIELAELSKTGNAAAKFPAIVDIVEPMGPETNLYLQTGAHTVVCRSQRALDHRETGHRLQFELNVNKTHLFDPATTSRVV